LRKGGGKRARTFRREVQTSHPHRQTDHSKEKGDQVNRDCTGGEEERGKGQQRKERRRNVREKNKESKKTIQMEARVKANSKNTSRTIRKGGEGGKKGACFPNPSGEKTPQNKT